MNCSERIYLGKIAKNQIIGLELLIFPSKSKVVIGRGNGPNPLAQFRSPVWIFAGKAKDQVRVREVDSSYMLKLFKTDNELFAKLTKILVGQLSILVKVGPENSSDGIPLSYDAHSSPPKNDSYYRGKNCGETVLTFSSIAPKKNEKSYFKEFYI